MTTLGQVMLYCIDQEKIARFWVEQLMFSIAGRQDYGETFAIELHDETGGGTKLVLQNKTAVAKMDPSMNLGAPSILLETTSFDEVNQRLRSAGGTVGDTVAFPGGKRVFNFADPEDNYFAIIER